MARYYGTIQGRRGEASRLGDRSSGIRASVCSWAGRVETSIQALSGDEDKHIVHIRAETHGSSDNPTGPIFTGTFEELGELIDWWNRRTEINAVLAMLPSAASKPRELPWSDMKAAFDIDDPEALWSQLDQLHSFLRAGRSSRRIAVARDVSRSSASAAWLTSATERR